MRIAIEGCAHGELENIYDTISLLEEKNNFKIDLLICCGDFQSSRNVNDLMCMAIPEKYHNICTFYKYYSGEKKAPLLTIFIGGNHEASNYLQELPYGGWVAPNIYYLGYAGVINIAGIRIGGLSGIYKGHDYMRGHYEKPPYTENSKRSVYHIRNLEVFRLKQLSGKLDIFLTHDWPSDVVNFGNVKQLLKRKPMFKEEIDKGELGSKPYNEILYQLKPTYWFSAHLHCKYAALVKHTDNSTTKFLSLDKCLPKRRFLQILEIPHEEESKIEIKYDIEWLAILHSTNHLLWVRNTMTYMPGPGIGERYNFTPSDDEKQNILNRFNDNLVVPKIYYQTARPHSPNSSSNFKQPDAILNPQTVNFCETLGIDDPLILVCKNEGTELNVTIDQNDSISFIDESFEEGNSFNSTQITPIKKLNLPEPKVEDTSEDIKNKDEAKETDDKGDFNKFKTNEVEDFNNRSNSPVVKKFKRRNVELYANEKQDN